MTHLKRSPCPFKLPLHLHQRSMYKFHPSVRLILQLIQDIPVKNEQWQYRLTPLQGMIQASIVIQPQVPAEPENGYPILHV